MSETSILEEKFEMTELEYLKIWDDEFTDQLFNVRIPPKSQQLVLYSTDPAGNGSYKYNCKFWSSVYPEYDDQEMKKIALEKANKVHQRSLGGKLYEIFIHSYSYEQGFCLYYINKSIYKYVETLKMEYNNVVLLDGSNQDIFYIALKPGEDLLLRFKPQDITKSFSYKTKINMKIYNLKNQSSTNSINSNINSKI